MPYNANQQWEPGPNDYHVAKGGTIEAGLGPDELSQEKAKRMRLASERRLEELKNEVARETELLSEKEQELERREHQTQLREQKIKALAKRAGLTEEEVASVLGDEDEEDGR